MSSVWKIIHRQTSLCQTIKTIEEACALLQAIKVMMDAVVRCHHPKHINLAQLSCLQNHKALQDFNTHTGLVAMETHCVNSYCSSHPKNLLCAYLKVDFSRDTKRAFSVRTQMLVGRFKRFRSHVFGFVIFWSFLFAQTYSAYYGKEV